MSVEVPLRCTCGAFRGVVRDFRPASSNRTVCYCDDCQAWAHWLGRAGDVLDAHGGTEIIPVRPRHFGITQGREQMRCARLVPNGMFRWYARCCRTPIANSMASPKIPFVGLHTASIDLPNEGAVRDAMLGRKLAGVQGRFAVGGVPPGVAETASIGIILRTLCFLAVGVLTRQHTPSPFLDPSGRPIVEAQVLSEAERDALRSLCGPSPTVSA